MIYCSFDLSFSDERDDQSLKKLNDFFMQASFMRPPTRASNPQVHDEAFSHQSALNFYFEKNQLEQNA